MIKAPIKAPIKLLAFECFLGQETGNELEERDGKGSGNNPGRNRTWVAGIAAQCTTVRARVGPEFGIPTT